MHRHRFASPTAVAIGVVLALVAASCSGDDASDDGATLPEPAPTTTSPATTDESPTTTSGATTTAAPEPTTPETTVPQTTVPETTVPATTAPSGPSADTAAFLIGGEGETPLLPLGWWDGTTWRAADDEFPITGGETATLVAVDTEPLTGTVSVPTGEGDFVGEACFDGRPGFDVDIELGPPEIPGFGYSTLAVVAPWDPVPRPAEAVGLEVEEYRQIGAAMVDDLGGDGSLGDVAQVLRVDLDGDGTDEVLVTFEHVQESILGAPGDYSIVYLRAPDPTGPADDAVTDTVVAEWLVDPDLPDDEFPFLLRSRVMAVADLDGDGTMEIALHRWYYEGAAVEAFAFADRTTVPVAANGCGA